jgi:hypothetical protein
MKLKGMCAVLAMLAMVLVCAVPAMADQSKTFAGEPEVSSTTPDDNDINVAIDVIIKVHFSDVMDTDETEDAVSISPVVAMTFDWNDAETTLYIDAALKNGVKYTVTISDDAQNETGTNMVDDYDFDFTTVSAPALTSTDTAYAWLYANWLMVLLLLLIVVVLIVFAYSSSKKRK